MKILLVIFCVGCFLITNEVNAQNIISGKIKTEKNIVIEGANILIYKKQESKIFRYAISDKDGNYTIKVDGALDSIILKISALGMESQSKMIFNASQLLNFTLKENPTKLPTVEINKNPVTVKGDTTSYNVDYFTTSRDRVIGDIIARLPGIEVDANGTIKYNGKAISNYYINGLDLLESRYGVANENIPYDLVEKVQVLNNHQPIRMLDSIKQSTDVALNIQLKKKGLNKVVTTFKLGAGTPLIQSDEALSAMKFSPGFQIIGAYKFNNTGAKPGNELMQQATISEVGAPPKDNFKENIVSLASDAVPALNTSRYLFNTTHLFHLSALKVLKNKANVKFNLGYINEDISNNSFSNNRIFLPSDTVNFSEKIESQIHNQKINGDFYYTLNKSNNYIKNATLFEIDLNKEKGIILIPQVIGQNLQNPFYQACNNLNILFPYRHKIINFQSSTIINRTPQILSIAPGQFSEIFNKSLPFESISQNAVLSKFSTDNYINWNGKMGKARQEWGLGLQFIYKKIESSISKDSGQSSIALNNNFQNNLNWKNLRFYTRENTNIKIRNKVLNISLPLELNLVSSSDNVSFHKQEKVYFSLNSYINLLLPYLKFFTTQFSYSRQTILGNFLETTPGYILSNYRTLSRNDSLLSHDKNNFFSVQNSYQNPLRGVTGTLSFSYSMIKHNLLSTQTYNQQFLNRSSIAFPNTSDNVNISAVFNKFFYQAKTSVTVSGNYFWNRSLVFRQSAFLNSFVRTFSFGNKIFSELSSFLSFQNSSTVNIFSNSNELINQPKLSFSNYQFNDNFKIFYDLTKKMNLNFTTDYYNFWGGNFKTNNYLFADAGIKYKFRKFDVEINYTNITNNRYFTIASLKGNSQSTTKIAIRPSSVLLKVYFKL